VDEPIQAGVPFRCMRCGSCCRVPGYVHLGPGEAGAIAVELGMPLNAFTETYTRLADNRQGLSLIEQADGACVFLESDNICRIQGAKPRQCRDFPVEWRYKRADDVCPATQVERGRNETE
jgi:uncharacterized protein